MLLNYMPTVAINLVKQSKVVPVLT